jgi:hypothetical protein
MNEKNRTAKLSVELEPADDPRGDTKCNCHIEGNATALMNAYEQMTIHLLNTLMEELGKEETMGLYAFCQVRALRGIGINPEAEVEESKRKVELLKKLSGIFGKTFDLTKEGSAE